ncbi:RNA polymerase sigma-70 factor [Aureivirga sp. CE67]|uniref:RNA polymerase sigma-70 factor n=1 Tax=Aureivirga sp. CE67 TaxID=1788983 RepID=UPI0018CB444D|nr:RNA polymerase sigma-70 factor [Aureivirga sp. CE67]
MQTTDNLTTTFLEGDIKSYELLFKRHYLELCLFANKYVNCSETAEEIVQDLFCKVWEKRKTLNIKTCMKSYLYGAVKLNCLSYLRDQEIRSKHLKDIKNNIDTTLYSDELEENELKEKIYLAIRQLPEQRRKIFELSRFENLKYREIAEKMDLSPKTIENQMSKALKFMRANLKDYLRLILLYFLLK